jgi:hypothetical protein
MPFLAPLRQLRYKFTGTFAIHWLKVQSRHYSHASGLPS